MLSLALAACDGPSKGSPSSSSAVGSSHPTAARSREGTTVPTASESPSARFAGRWTGPYTAERAAVHVPKGVPDKTWATDDGSRATGDGTLDLTIDEAHQVSGSAQGALGRLTIRGALDGTTLRAGVVPVDPNGPVAMWGVLVGEMGPKAARCQLRVSNRDGRLVRVASVELRRR